MDLHSGEQIIFKGRPSWRSTLQFYLGGLVLAAVAGVIGALVQDTGTGIGIGVGVFAVVLVVGFLKRLGTHYVVTNERLHIRRGLISKHIQETRLERVQNVNTDQSVFERILQIGTVDFDTAGTTDSDFSFTGVAQPERVVAAVDRAQRSQSQPAAAAPAPPAAAIDAPPATAE
ncbi:MAG: PH domain-containing protein [Solirubrobacteraceae bacterium]